MSSNLPPPTSARIPPEAHIAVAAARFNGEIVAELLARCLSRLKALGTPENHVSVRYVPGAFELPLAAKMLARSREYSAVICLGCVIRGQTPHFDFVAGECARGIMEVSLSEMTPVIFGVLTTDDEQQAPIGSIPARAPPTLPPKCSPCGDTCSVDPMAGPTNRFPGDLALQLTRRRLQFFEEIARQYGDVVSYGIRGRRIFLFSHPDAIREILVTHGEAFNKGPVLRQSQAVLGEGLLTSEGDFHRRQHRIAQPVFHPQRMTAYSPIIVEYAKTIADRWSDGKPIDVHREMMRLALQIVSKTLFGAEVEGEIEEIGRAMEIIVGRFTRLLSPIGQILNRLPLPGNFIVKRSVRRLHKTLDRFIAAEQHGGHGLVSLLSQARDVEGDQAR